MGVTELRPGVSFRDDAAKSWARMEAEKGSNLDTNRTTVSYQEQQDVYDELGWPAALPPDASMHVWKENSNQGGIAADTDDHQWVRHHPEHGWVFPHDNIGEWWHCEYRPDKDQHKDETTDKKGYEPQMYKIIESLTSGRGRILMTPVGMYKLSNSEQLRIADMLVQSQGKNLTNLTPAEFDQIKRFHTYATPPTATVTLSDAQIQELADAIVAENGNGSVPLNAEEIVEAVKAITWVTTAEE